jgi:hypothetical protein
MHFGTPEVVISSMAILLLFSGRITTMISGRSVEQILGIRTLTFESRSDIVIALVIVAASLATALLLAHK